GLQMSGGALVPGTNQAVRFAGKASVTISPGESAWSDAVSLPFVKGQAGRPTPQRPLQAELAGRRMAVGLLLVDESGPMTWHAKALTTSYLTGPGAGSKGQFSDESAFPFTTTSWYFLDAVDMMAPATTRVIVAYGDSITDGTASTLNGDDRWPN